MTRRPDWHSRFVAMIDEVRREPFAWDSADCSKAWVGRLVHELTGVDHTKDFGKYSTLKGAVKVMKSKGVKNLADLIALYLPEIHPSQAYIGDIATIKDDSPFGYALGIVNGDRIFVRREDGVGTVDLLEADRAFKV